MFAEVARAAGRVEIPETDRSQPVELAVPLEEPLEHELGFSIRTDWFLRHFFCDGHGFRYAEDCAGGGEHKIADTGMNAGFEEIDTVGNVVAEIFRGIRHAFRYERVG